MQQVLISAPEGLEEALLAVLIPHFPDAVTLALLCEKVAHDALQQVTTQAFDPAAFHGALRGQMFTSLLQPAILWPVLPNRGGRMEILFRQVHTQASQRLLFV